jgi:hypothetical protein
MGDQGKLYVAPALVDAHRTLLLPRASVLVPNQVRGRGFEPPTSASKRVEVKRLGGGWLGQGACGWAGLEAGALAVRPQQLASLLAWSLVGPATLQRSISQSYELAAMLAECWALHSGSHYRYDCHVATPRALPPPVRG